ncbi:rhodanese-like domain-containing protein [Rubinisphaera italica]|nr:rhodanese-like domain-containing protein [Rubinisphaera italica]
MSVHDLDKKRKSEKQLTILDFRTDKEWNEGHIEEAMHINGGTLQNRVEEISKDKPVVVVCGSGYRASIASSFLQRQGFEAVTNVIGGMSGAG